MVRGGWGGVDDLWAETFLLLSLRSIRGLRCVLVYLSCEYFSWMCRVLALSSIFSDRRMTWQRCLGFWESIILRLVNTYKRMIISLCTSKSTQVQRLHCSAHPTTILLR